MYRSNDSCCDQITWVAPHTLVFVDDYRVKTLNPSSRRIKQIAGFSDFAVSPNGRWVAGYADTGGHAAEFVDVVPLAGGECLAVPKKPDQDDADPSFSSNSAVVYVERRHFSTKLGYDVGPTVMVQYRLSMLRTIPTC
jgi:tricorn protease-like protein